MLNSCVLKQKYVCWTHVHKLSHWSFWCTSGITTTGSKVLYTPVRSLVCSVPHLQHEICILQLTNVVKAWQWAQCSFLYRWSGWPRWSMGNATMQVDVVSSGSQLCIQGWRLHRDNWIIQAPPLSNRPPSIIGSWAASTHECLPGTVCYKCGAGQHQSSKNVWKTQAYVWLMGLEYRAGCISFLTTGSNSERSTEKEEGG